MKRRSVALGFGLLVVLAAMVLGWSGRRATPGIAEVLGMPGMHVLVLKDPTCTCCDRWEEHLVTAGFEVEARTTDDLEAIRAEARIPALFESCHTAFVDGYFIEGHVPADVIIHLLKRRPAIAGLVVPGMPVGSPGMTDGPAEPFDVYAVDAGRRVSLYARR